MEPDTSSSAGPAVQGRSGAGPDPANGAGTIEHTENIDRSSITKAGEPADSHKSDIADDATAAEQDESEYQVHGLRLFLILLALLTCIFCQALDDTIIATAIPRITDTFNALNDIGWYGSAYLLTLFYGKLYTVLPLRWVFLWSLFLFEVGSLIAAVSPSSPTLIGGRAVAGTGAAGITSGALNIMAHVTPVERRPLFVSLIGAVYGIASVIGPIIGGAFAERVTWRWNFYLNLPIGGAAVVILLLTLRRLPPSAQGQKVALLTALRRFDLTGTLAFAASIICLLMALNWAPTIYPWYDGRIIALLTLFAAFLIIFILSQILQSSEYATIPKRIAKNRNIVFGAVFAFCQGAAFNLFVFYLPIYFQAIKNASPIQSGVDYLPLILINTVAILFAGALTSKIGYNVPWFWASSILMAVGAGLLTLLRVNSSTGQWVGFQILFAIGSGLGLQQPFVTAQISLPLTDIGVGTGMMMFAQLGGGAIFVSVAQTVFSQRLVTEIDRLGLTGLDTGTLVHEGATAIRSLVSPQDLPAVLQAYNMALTSAYKVGLIMSCISIIGPAGMKWIPVNADKKGNDKEKRRVEEDKESEKQ